MKIIFFGTPDFSVGTLEALVEAEHEVVPVSYTHLDVYKRQDIDSIIYGLILTYILTVVVDKVMYGIDAGKMALIVTDKGPELSLIHI